MLLDLTVVLSVYGVAGTVGNALILIVYGRSKTKMAHSTYIRVLAVADLLVCCVVVPYSIAYEHRAVTSDVACRGLEMLRHALVIFSSQTLCAIAAERHASVFRPVPLRGRRSVSSVIVIVAVVSLCIAAPSATIFSVSSGQVTGHPTSGANETQEVTSQESHRSYCRFTPTIVSETWATAYQGVLAFQFVVVTLIIVVLYIKVHKEIWRRARWRRKLAPRIRVSGVQRSSPGPGRAEWEHGARTEAISFVTRTGNCNAYPSLHPAEKRRTEQSTSALTGSPLRLVPAAFSRSEAISQEGSANMPPGFEFAGEKSHDVRCTTVMTKIPVVNAQQNIPVKTSLSPQAARAGTVTVDCFCNDKTAVSSLGRPQALDNRRKAATMLFICTIIFIVTWLPFWIDVFNLTCSLTFRYTFFLGHVTNPVVYGIVNPKVREEARRTLLCH